MSNRQISKKKVFSNKAATARREKAMLVDHFGRGLIGVAKIDECENTGAVINASYRAVFRGNTIGEAKAISALRALFIRHGLKPSIAARMTDLKFL